MRIAPVSIGLTLAVLSGCSAPARTSTTPASVSSEDYRIEVGPKAAPCPPEPIVIDIYETGEPHAPVHPDPVPPFAPAAPAPGPTDQAAAGKHR